jgi:serine/threonine protein kinase
VLIDFGLAVLTEREIELTEAGVAVGTPEYMAPEQALGDEDRSAATDVYGLGAVLAFALTGRTLYPGVKRHDMRDRWLLRHPIRLACREPVQRRDG